jgi:hypothetical protein
MDGDLSVRGIIGPMPGRPRHTPSSRRPLSAAGLTKLALIGCLGLAACEPASWVKDGATRADHDRDVNECQSASQRTTIFGRSSGDLAIQNSFSRCMTLRGYVLKQ